MKEYWDEIKKTVYWTVGVLVVIYTLWFGLIAFVYTVVNHATGGHR